MIVDTNEIDRNIKIMREVEQHIVYYVVKYKSKLR